jgi:hypothetical protein
LPRTVKNPARSERSERTKLATASCCLWHPSFRREQHDRACRGVRRARPRSRYHGARRRSSRSPWGLDGSSRLTDDGCSMGCTNRLNTEQPNPAPRRVPVLQREPATCALCRLNTFRARTPPALRELVRMGCGLSQVDKVGTGGKDRMQSAWDGGQGSWHICFLSTFSFRERISRQKERKEKERRRCSARRSKEGIVEIRVSMIDAAGGFCDGDGGCPQRGQESHRQVRRQLLFGMPADLDAVGR